MEFSIDPKSLKKEKLYRLTAKVIFIYKFFNQIKISLYAATLGLHVYSVGIVQSRRVQQ